MRNRINWFRILSPCILVSLFLLLLMIGSLFWLPEYEGMNIMGVIVLLPFLLGLLLVGIVTKALIKNASSLWITELIVIAIAVLIGISFYLDK